MCSRVLVFSGGRWWRRRVVPTNPSPMPTASAVASAGRTRRHRKPARTPALYAARAQPTTARPVVGNSLGASRVTMSASYSGRSCQAMRAPMVPTRAATAMAPGTRSAIAQRTRPTPPCEPGLGRGRRSARERAKRQDVAAARGRLTLNHFHLSVTGHGPRWLTTIPLPVKAPEPLTVMLCRPGPVNSSEHHAGKGWSRG